MWINTRSSAKRKAESNASEGSVKYVRLFAPDILKKDFEATFKKYKVCEIEGKPAAILWYDEGEGYWTWDMLLLEGFDEEGFPLVARAFLWPRKELWEVNNNPRNMKDFTLRLFRSVKDKECTPTSPFYIEVGTGRLVYDRADKRFMFGKLPDDIEASGTVKWQNQTRLVDGCAREFSAYYAKLNEVRVVPELGADLSVNIKIN